MARIFLVESGTEKAKDLAKELKSRGHDSKIISNCRNLANEVASEEPDLLLLDIDLEGHEGLEVLRDIKKNSKTKTVPVVIFTNVSEEVGYTQAMDAGAYDYIVKSKRPVSQLVIMIDTILEETNGHKK